MSRRWWEDKPKPWPFSTHAELLTFRMGRELIRNPIGFAIEPPSEATQHPQAQQEEGAEAPPDVVELPRVRPKRSHPRKAP